MCIIEKNDNYYSYLYFFNFLVYIYIYFISTSILYHKWFDEVESNIPVKFREIWKKKRKKRTRSGIRGSSMLEYKTKSDYERLNFPLIFTSSVFLTRYESRTVFHRASRTVTHLEYQFLILNGTPSPRKSSFIPFARRSFIAARKISARKNSVRLHAKITFPAVCTRSWTLSMTRGATSFREIAAPSFPRLSLLRAIRRSRSFKNSPIPRITRWKNGDAIARASGQTGSSLGPISLPYVTPRTPPVAGQARACVSAFVPSLPRP